MASAFEQRNMRGGQLPSFFSPEAGQARSRRLQELDEELRANIRYAAGPGFAEAIEKILGIGPQLLPSADVVDVANQSRDLVSAIKDQDLGGAGLAGLNMLGSLGMAALPGTGTGVRGAVDDLVGGAGRASPPAAAAGPPLDPRAGPAVPPMADLPGAPAPTRVSTRLPTAARRTEDPSTGRLSIDLASAREGDVGAHNIRLLADTPGLRLPPNASNDEILDTYLDHATGNLNFLMDRLPVATPERTKRWYEGANRLSGALSNRYDVPRQSSSAAIAALSPQRDWFQNASLAERVGDIMFADRPVSMSSEMRDFVSQRMARVAEGSLPQLPPGITLADIDDPDLRAIFIRSFDEVNNPRHYRSILPTGELGDFIMTQKGQRAGVGWGSLNEISKAARAFGSGGDMSIISPLLGEMHKVRNFYNNIELPQSTFNRGDVTADTHAVAANQFRPLSGTSTPVMQNFGTAPLASQKPADWKPSKSSSISGVMGTYGLNMEPYFRVAGERGLLPREVQSITWEAVRDLFEASSKTARGKELVDDIWKSAGRGEITPAQARELIFNSFGGYTTGGGAGPRTGRAPEAAGASTYR